MKGSHRLLAVFLLSCHALLLAWEGRNNSPTLDELGHLPAGIRHWKTGEFDLYRVNPPLVRMIAAIPALLSDVGFDWSIHDRNDPLSRAEFFIGQHFVSTYHRDALPCFVSARLFCIPLSLLGGFFSYRWATEMFGPASGTFCLALWCFDPNVLAHGALITPDLGGATFGLIASYYFWRWTIHKRTVNAFLVGSFAGLAILAKSTWLLLIVTWPTMVLGLLLLNQKQDRMHWFALSTHSLLAISCAVLVINCGYGFEGTFRPLGQYRFVSQEFTADDNINVNNQSPVDNRFANAWTGQLPVLIPANFLLGIDVQMREFEKGKWSYLRGRQQFGGWWYYYLYAFLVKVPEGTLAALCLTLVLSCATLRSEQTIRNFILTCFPGLVLIAFVSAQTGFSRHFRYVLPALPLLYVWISQVASCHLHWMRVTAIALVALSTISSLMVFPHSLSYFNSISGGPRQGHYHLLDSNIDWGQDLLYLADWQRKHPECTPFYEDIFGTIDPAWLGIKSDNRHTAGHANIIGIVPGWYAVSVNHLREYRHWGFPLAPHHHLLQLEPVDMAGYSICIYHITATMANRIRREYGLPEWSDDESVAVEYAADCH